MPNFKKVTTLGALAEQVQAELIGDPQQLARGVSTLAAATRDEVSFFTNAVYKPDLLHTQAAAVLLKREDATDCPVAQLIVADPHVAYAKIACLCVAPPVLQAETFIHERALVHPTAQIGQGVSIGPGVVVEAGAQISDACTLEPNVVVGAGARIGAGSYLHANVVLYPDVILGERNEIHSQTVIGSDGFGFAFDRTHWIKVPQLGSVRIGDDVEIGAQTTIDRGAIEDTIIENGVKIDNRVQIGHNVVIGAHTVIAGCAAFAGSSKIGRYCLIGGGATFAGHITVCDRVQVAGMTTVTRSIDKPGVYASGTGMLPAAQWRRAVVHFRHLDDYFRRLKILEGFFQKDFKGNKE